MDSPDGHRGLDRWNVHQFLHLHSCHWENAGCTPAGKLMGAAMKRFRVMVYISMLTFIITGIIMGSLHLNYEGAFQSGNPMIAILIFKVPLYVIMVILAIVAFELHAPELPGSPQKDLPQNFSKPRSPRRFWPWPAFCWVIILALSAAL